VKQLHNTELVQEFSTSSTERNLNASQVVDPISCLVRASQRDSQFVSSFLLLLNFKHEKEKQSLPAKSIFLGPLEEVVSNDDPIFLRAILVRIVGFEIKKIMTTNRVRN
jgi:hypothetical protein